MAESFEFTKLDKSIDNWYCNTTKYCYRYGNTLFTIVSVLVLEVLFKSIVNNPSNSN